MWRIKIINNVCEIALRWMSLTTLNDVNIVSGTVLVPVLSLPASVCVCVHVPVSVCVRQPLACQRVHPIWIRGAKKLGYGPYCLCGGCVGGGVCGCGCGGVCVCGCVCVCVGGGGGGGGRPSRWNLTWRSNSTWFWASPCDTYVPSVMS